MPKSAVAPISYTTPWDTIQAACRIAYRLYGFRSAFEAVLAFRRRTSSFISDEGFEIVDQVGHFNFHAKRCSLPFSGNGVIALAPLHDMMAALAWPAR
jgi:hypothetical protein